MYGTYLLQISVQHSVSVRFGRFQQGRSIAVPAGAYVYVGSALGKAGSSTLESRVLRHARRSSGRPPHGLIDALHDTFYPGRTAGDPVFVRPKRLHWHVDYLLDELAADLRAVYLVKAVESLERALAAFLMADPAVSVLAPGLGASDAVGSHLLCAPTDTVWWARLPKAMSVVTDAAPVVRVGSDNRN